MDTQMKQTGNGGRTALGFFLTFFMTITLMVNGIVMGVKTTILNGSDVSEVLENLNVYEVMSEIISSEISKATSGNTDEGTDVSLREGIKVVTTTDVGVTDDNSSSITISDEAIQAIFGEDILKEVTKSITDSIKNEQDVDLTGVKDQCMTNVEALAMDLIDDVIDEVQTIEGDTISADTLKNLKSVQKMKSDYGVDADTIITDYVKEKHGADTINIADVDFEALRTEAKSTVTNDIMPELDKTMDTYIADVSKSVNETIKEANETYNMSGLINGIEGAINTLNIVMIVCIVLAVLFAALEMVVYKTAINRGFRNVFISTLVAGIFTLVVAILVGTIKSLIISAIGGENDTTSMAVSKLISDNIAAVGDRIMIISVVYIVIAVACLVAAIVIKKKLDENNNDGMGSLSDGSVLV